MNAITFLNNSVNEWFRLRNVCLQISNRKLDKKNIISVDIIKRCYYAVDIVLSRRFPIPSIAKKMISDEILPQV